MDGERRVAVMERHAAAHAGVLVAVPFYKNEHLVAPLVASLIRCAADLAAIGAEVVFYDDSPFYPELRTALEDILPRARAAFACRLVRNGDNLGFVRTMNLAVAEAAAHGRDLLLLNSDTEVEPGALPEMARVMRLDHMIGFVNPRSNNATIATLPVRAVPAGRAAALAAYMEVSRRLPDISYVPTAVGFCMLISWRVLAEFGGFDTVYGKGYNEENDLVMRASRCGFRAVLANHAFVWHEGEQSFSTAAVDRSVLEPANRAVLDARYPEYGPYTAAFYDAPETLAERLIAALQPDAQGKRELAFDFSSFRMAHNGTFVAGRQMLAVAQKVWGEHFNISVLCAEEVYDFHDYGALCIKRADPHGGQRFAVIFRVGQPYDFNVLQRLAVTGAVIGVYMLDTISIDCPQLTSQLLYNMWQFTLENVDVIATQSRQTAAQFAARFAIPAEAARVVSLHSLDIGDYVLPVDEALVPARGAGPLILVLGNHYHHKYVARTANALAAAFPGRAILALGQEVPEAGEKPDPMAVPPLDILPNLSGREVGAMTDADMGAQYRACDAVVFPSHAEGFGFPVLNALAMRRPVFVRRLPVFEELWQGLGQCPNMHFYDSTADLIGQLAELPRWVEWTPPAGQGAERSAREIKAALDAAIEAAGYARMVRRIRAVQFASSQGYHGRGGSSDTPAAQVAHFLAERIETVLRGVFSFAPVYWTSRLAFRAVRRTRRLFVLRK